MATTGATKEVQADKTGFKPKAIVRKLLTSLPERSRTVLEARFGLGAVPDRVTLESIGKKYGITRERVRQIENHALASLKKSPAFGEAAAAFGELERIVDSLGLQPKLRQHSKVSTKGSLTKT